MGTSKLMGASNNRFSSLARNNNTIFASTRFGNVLGSSGSVIPIFVNQINTGSDITVTHKEMTRFIMSIQDAVELVIKTAGTHRGRGFFTKMPVVRITDLAQAMIEEMYDQNKIKTLDIPINLLEVNLAKNFMKNR